jgi:HSP20 family protein
VPGGRDVDRLQDEIEELFADLWRVPRFSGLRRGFRPPVDCFRTDDPPELTIVVELAGVEADEIELVAVDGELVVRGERRRPHLQHRPSFYQLEIEYGPFQRRVGLPEDADTSRGRATYHAGFLTVVLPIEQRPKRPSKVSIPLKVAK